MARACLLARSHTCLVCGEAPPSACSRGQLPARVQGAGAHSTTRMACMCVHVGAEQHRRDLAVKSEEKQEQESGEREREREKQRTRTRVAGE